MFGDFSRDLDSLLTLQRAMDRAMGQDFFGQATASRGSHPAVSITRNGGNYLVTCEIPGVRKEDIGIEVKGDLLRIFGERLPDYQTQEVSVHRQERRFGKFDRTVKLPFAIDGDKVAAIYEAGVLSITVPPVEAEKPKRIQVVG